MSVLLSSLYVMIVFFKRFILWLVPVETNLWLEKQRKKTNLFFCFFVLPCTWATAHVTTCPKKTVVKWLEATFWSLVLPSNCMHETQRSCWNIASKKKSFSRKMGFLLLLLDSSCGGSSAWHYHRKKRTKNNRTIQCPSTTDVKKVPFETEQRNRHHSGNLD